MHSEKPESWGIIGGGALGMTLAWRLAQRGQQVTLFEAGPNFGGLAGAWKLGEITWDRFYHVILLSDTHLRALLQELGLENQMQWVQTRTGFYSGGRLHSMSNAWEFLRFPLLNLWEKFRLGCSIIYASRIQDYRRLEKIPVEDWLRRISGRGTYRKIWLPLLRSKLGEMYKQTSAAFIWAYISRMYKARRTGLKREMFGYVPGGYATILDRFADALESVGVELRPDHAVREIVADSNGGGINIEFNGQPSRRFDRVISTIPAPLVSKTTPQLAPHEHQRLNDVQYLGVICASLLLRKPLAGYYVTNITDSDIPLTGVIEMSAIVDSQTQLGGHHLVYLPKYVSADDQAAFSESDDSIRARLLGTLTNMYPDFRLEDVVEFKVARARYVMSLPTMNYSDQLPPVATSLPGYYVINSAQIVKGNLNVNETIQIGDECLEQWVYPELQQAPRPTPLPVLPAIAETSDAFSRG